MSASRVQKQQEEHEAFKNRLVEDVLGQEDDGTGKVPMEKVVMLMWAFRDDPSVVTYMARFVGKYSASRHVFDGVEFYLPQLAHMIIHLEVDWDDAILERFALVIAQQSLHFALQLHWILQGALEDYQPQLPDGTPNPTYNAVFYQRCLALARNVERCVVYGKPRAQELQKLYESGKITKTEMVMMEQADRRFNALQITNSTEDAQNQQLLEGWLGFSTTQPPLMDQRFCTLEGHVLSVFKAPGCCVAPTHGALKLEQAFSIHHAVVKKVTQKPQITVSAPHDVTITLQCQNSEEATLWARRLEEEASTKTMFRESGANTDSEKNAMEERLVQDLTPAQWDRYQFYKDERKFVADLVQIAEDLRFKDRDERKQLAPELMAKLEIPERVYSPLCNSSDIWRRIDCAVSKETRVFNTKERCPVVMQFLAKRGEPLVKKNGNTTTAMTASMGSRMDPNLDVAEYMHNCLEVRQEDNMESLQEDPNEDDEDTNHEPDTIRDELQDSKHDSVWVDDDEGEAGPSTPVANPAAQGGKRGNRRVQRLVRDSVALPAILARRLKTTKDKKHNKRSVMDKQTTIQPQVPILAGTHSIELVNGVHGGSLRRLIAENDSDNNSVGNSSHVSVERSSVMVNHTIVPGDLEEGDIDVSSINKAKDFVSGGESWAEKTGRMLNDRSKDSGNDDDDVQKEIVSCLAKSNDDLRQEVFVMQMIHYYKSVFAKAKLPLWLKTYRILSTSKDTGILELLTDATSLDGLKKSEGYPTDGGLRKYFEMVYGGADTKAFKAAQTNFMQSLAGYALVSYFLGLKDRHNGNVMIDTRGHLIHIDFGFAFGMAPGHEFSMERAPFKLTKEYVEVMGGVGSDCYKEFEKLFVAGFQEARKNSQIALGLVEIMMFKSNYPCFVGRRYGSGKALVGLEKRLMLRVPDHLVERKALRLIRKSRRHTGTFLYDRFQLATNGYAM